MSRLIESICLNDGVFYRLPHHQARMNKSIHEIFHQQNEIQLEDFLYAQSYPTQGLFKCRIIYDIRTHSVEFIPYKTKPVSSLKIIKADSIEYAHKFEDRSALHQLYQLREDCDDVLIVKNGFLADSYYSNVILYDGGNWVTPSTPLLAGTMRQYLLETGKISEATIRVEDVRLFQKVKLINAMLGLDGPELSISQIVF